jgi:hypothetical protein
MTVRAIVDYIYNTLASGLFYFIETIITPHITAEGTIEVMFWFFTIPLLITNLILAILSSFTNYRNIFIKTTTGHGYVGKDLTSLNYARKFLKATTLADIATTNGVYISRNAFEARSGNRLREGLGWPRARAELL